MKKPWGKFSVILSLSFLSACGASSIDEKIENARFLVDQPFDAVKYTAAQTEAQAALTADPTNVDAALLLSSADAGLAGIKLTKVIPDVMDTAGVSGSNNDFAVIHDALAKILKKEADITNLRKAIEALRTDLKTPPAATDSAYGQYHMQLGMLQTLAAFSVPMLHAEPFGNTADNYDPSKVVAADRDNAENDFIEADDNLVAANLSGNDVTTTIRQNFCALKSVPAATDKAGEAFTLEQLRDLVRCQLDSTPLAPNTPFEAVATCADFDFAGCTSAGDTKIK